MTHFFWVANTWKENGEVKVADEIRMVYDATKSILNKAVYKSWLSMLTVKSHLRAVEGGTYMTDCDVGKMFLNFMIEPSFRPHVGLVYLIFSLKKL